MNAETYTAREDLLRAANRALMADRLDHSGANDAAEQEYADDQLTEAAQKYVATTEDLSGVFVRRERLEHLEAIERRVKDEAAAAAERPAEGPFIPREYVPVHHERVAALERLEVLVRAYATAHADGRTMDKITATSALRAAVRGRENEGRYVVLPEAKADRHAKATRTLNGLEAALDLWLFHVALTDHALCEADARLARSAMRARQR